MSPTTHGLSRKESTIKSKLKLGTSWTQQQQAPPAPSSSLPATTAAATQPQQPATEVAGTEHQATSERDASKMRKPSFWSIFRGGSSQRKEAEEKKEAEASLQQSGSKQHFLKKQQSASSGFAENFGFSKLLTLADSKYGTVSSTASSSTVPTASDTASNLFTNKVLPSVPPLPLPQQQPKQQQMDNRSEMASSQNQEYSAATTTKPDQTSQLDKESAAPAPLVSMNSDFSASSVVDGALDSARLSNGGFYTPMQEMFPLSSDSVNADENGLAASSSNTQREGADNEQSRKLVQGADSQSACTPSDSPIVVSSSIRCDSGATPELVVAASADAERDVVTEGEYDDDDDGDVDSDIVPLSRSKALIEAQAARGTLLASQQPLEGGLASPSTDGGAAGLGIVSDASRMGNEARVHASEPSVAANGAAVADAAAAKPHPPSQPCEDNNAAGGQKQPLTVNVDRSDAAELAGSMMAPGGARMQFSPDKPTHDLSLASDSAAAKPACKALAEKDAASSLSAVDSNGMSHDSSIQARAMGKYLYDIEEYSCRFYSQTNRKSAERPVEPPRPEVLMGFEVPHLVDHAEWLGKREIFNGMALKHYIANYDFSGMRIDECLRRLCSHIFLRGESQVIDRLLVALSQRYVECNPDTRLRSVDVAHAVTYSTLLLNTDLHIADIRAGDRMTKSRFVRNTVDTIAQFQQSAGPANGEPTNADDVLAEDDVSAAVSPPPQLPELELTKKSMDGTTHPAGSLADTPSTTSSRLAGSSESYEMIAPVPAHQPVSTEHHSTLRSLVGSMASLNMSGNNGFTSAHSTTATRSSRDVVRLMGGRGKRFSFFESSSSSGGGNIGALGASIGVGSAAVSGAPSLAHAHTHAPTSSGGSVSAAQTPTMGMSSTHAVSSPSSLRAFDRLRRKVSTNGAHVRSRSGTLSMDEPSLAGLGGRASISSGQNQHHQRDGDTFGSMVGRAISAATGVATGDAGRAREAAAAMASASGMPNLTELSSVLKDVYAGIKSKPLGQPSFARQATILYEQAQHQNSMNNSSQYSAGHGLARSSHDQMRAGNARSSMALGPGGAKQSLDVESMGYGRHSQMAGIADHHDPHGHMGGARPSSVRSMPMHSVQRTRSITSMNKAAAANSGSAAVRRPPQHPDLRNTAFAPEGMKRSGSSMIHFGAAGTAAGMRASPSSASMGAGSGMGFLPSTAYTAYMRSPMENQHIRSGVLVRKHLFERAGKKASHRAWRTCYVSVDRGTVAMYKMDGRHNMHPDGRELTDTSLQLGSVSLRHTMTHMLPPPGYSRSRPHVFALQLPSGGVYLFQTASEVELRDWVAACNYWAARESKAPYMIGGVYNMEYGWDNTGDFALRFDEREARELRNESLSPSEQAAEERRIMEERDASKNANILEWTPPNNPMQRSDLDETAQLKALLHHISYLEDELVSHKKVQGSIDERFFPKTQMFHRAFGNWERKAQYILQELIKYQSYADVLQKALKQMQEELAPAIPEEPMTAASIAAPDSSIASSSPAMGSSSINGAYHQGHSLSHSQNHGHQYSPQQHSQQQQQPRVVPAGEAGYVHEEIDGHATASQQHAYHHSHGRASTSGPNSSAAAAAAAATLSASRASLPQAGGRRTTDSNGNPTSSKALPIKELLAPASEKARNRASIISPTSASSTATTATMTPLSAAGAPGAMDEKRRASHPHVTAMSAVSSPVPDS
ncbi:hypothetical protein IWW45_006570 [Coemansia sp. RSA 485]|nr:hypothetical protein IWW45_006570 [Coemansia sp. RSA 485]